MRLTILIFIFVSHVGFCQSYVKPSTPVQNGIVNVQFWTGSLSIANVIDNTSNIQKAINYAASMPSKKPQLYFPPGFYYVTGTLDFSQVDGWTISGVPNLSVISIPNGVTINGAIFNFNFNSLTIRRYNDIFGIYFFSDSFNGKALTCVDFSYNNRFSMRYCRTSRISKRDDISVHFAYEGVFEKCNFSGGRTISLASNGIHLSDEANVITIQDCAIDNYIGNSSDTIPGAAIWFEGSKGLEVINPTIQKSDYGAQISNGAIAAHLQGGYYEGNRYADIRLGSGSTGSIYSTNIEGGAVKSGSYGYTWGLLIDKVNVYGLSVSDVFFDCDDPIGLYTRTNQEIQNVWFNNARTGDTVFSFRNLIDSLASMYMDEIIVNAPGTPMNAQQNPSFTPIKYDPYTNYSGDFNQWTGGTLTDTSKYLGHKVWMKTNSNIETIVFSLDSINGFENQIVTFSMDIQYNGTINANDLLYITNQDNEMISFSRPLRPSSLPTTKFVKIYSYALVGQGDTEIRVKILTRDNGIQFSNPKLKLGFVL